MEGRTPSSAQRRGMQLSFESDAPRTNASGATRFPYCSTTGLIPTGTTCPEIAIALPAAVMS
jgi:hypothetical protein